MRLLLSNDDGYHATGLNTLRECLEQRFGPPSDDIVTAAPDRNCSGVSNALTLERPLRARLVGPGSYAIDGTPTDCVHLATTGFFEQRPDVVISGINAGSNLGDDVLYSGTVAAATEGRSLGLPAIAVSLAGTQLAHYETAARVVDELVKHLIDRPLAPDSVLNVNVPDVPFESLCGYRSTRLGNRHQGERVTVSADPRGRTIYWIGEAGNEADCGPGTDFYAVANNAVSITPLQTDRTRYPAIDDLGTWLGGL
ncbi:5'/3'-nucleotidase SurE [Salinisphaera sp. USBA-960]|uniref:5'/3'-nucleotidase SurE n=1 Tax=Salinisphaera orenii TaxID=856731 RepID=UPI000DBE3B8D|nr:5'/3'-nucleotidase SurE [Salifodinibacter halophilus]NNC26379.1 5'/3'-nucleotidase SurE [Salifodinibacter halophilus]